MALNPRSLFSGWRMVILFSAAIVGLPPAAIAAFKLMGVVVEGDIIEVNLVDAETNESLKWRRVGTEVNGFLIKSYDAERESVTLTKGNELVTLPLQRAKVVKTDPVSLGGQDTKTVTDLRLDAVTKVDLGNGKILHITPVTDEEGEIGYRSEVHYPDNWKGPKRTDQRMVIGKPGEPRRLVIDGHTVIFPPGK